MDTTVTRIQLNAYTDVTNVVDEKELITIIPPTLDNFINQLLVICGPFARNAMIIRADENIGTAMGSEMDMRMFLRDGKHTLKNTECISPIQQYIKSIILYIGSRIDSICKDGTTTSMLFACFLLRYILDTKNTFDWKMHTTQEIEAEFAKVFSHLESALQEDYITIDMIVKDFNVPENVAASVLAYLQAYTATSGDKEIAEAIATFFKYTPKEIWNDRIDHTVSRVEKTGYRCKADRVNYEYELPGLLLTTQYRNADLRTVVKLEDSDVIMFPDGLVDSSLVTDMLLKYLEKRLEHDKNVTPLVICSPGGNHCSPRIVDFINERAKTYGVTIPIVAYTLDTKFPVPWQAMVVNGKANVPSLAYHMELEECIIHGVSIYIDSTKIQFSGLTPNDPRLDESEIIHPGTKYSEDYTHWSKINDLIEGYLVTAKSKHEIEAAELHSLQSAHADLSVKTRMILRLGGFYHDQLALQPIIEDAAGSAMAAIKDGLVTNSLIRLRHKVAQLFGDDVVHEPDVRQDLSIFRSKEYITQSLGCILTKTTTSMVLALLGPMVSITAEATKESSNAMQKATSLANDMSLKKLNKYEYFDIRKVTGSHETVDQWFAYESLLPIIQTIIDGNYDDTNINLKRNGYPPVQTTKMFSELFARVQEVVVKFGLTSMVVVPGAAWNKAIR